MRFDFTRDPRIRTDCTRNCRFILGCSSHLQGLPRSRKGRNMTAIIASRWFWGFLLGSIISFLIFFVRNAKEIFNNSQIAHPQGSDRVKIFSGLLLRHTTGKKKSHFARVCTRLNSMRERERSETGEVTLFVLHTGVGTRWIQLATCSSRGEGAQYSQLMHSLLASRLRKKYFFFSAEFILFRADAVTFLRYFFLSLKCEWKYFFLHNCKSLYARGYFKITPIEYPL